MPTPGISDPYWYEWYLGLKHIIEMLNPESGIKCVIFQHPTYNAIDDIVVEYNNGTKQACYQVKHEISTSISSNLTFGKLLEKKHNDPTDKCLMEAIFSGWKKAISDSKTTIQPILFTNRKLSNRRSIRTFHGEKYNAYPIDKFLYLLKKELMNISDYSNLSFTDTNLNKQWKEMCESMQVTSSAEIALFMKEFIIQGNQCGFAEIEQLLISSLAETFTCRESLAKELFGKLVFGLRLWTSTRRDDERVTIEMAYAALGIEEDVNEEQHRLAPPYPFFESRQTFCKELEQHIINTDKKVVFISGEPGSGKTSTVSYLQSTTNLFLLRYHTFRPISPEQHFYNVDAGMYSSENLWGTLLIQLRQKIRLQGKLAQFNVPINNKLLTVEMMRCHVLRLLSILAKENLSQNSHIYVCIDGIDHAARTNNKVSFLSSLPLPNEIPDGVCFVIVGQPFALYQDQYPAWLSNNTDVEHIEMTKLCIADIKQLILSKTQRFKDVVDGLADFIYQNTEGNNLSTVFAVEEIKETQSIEDAMVKLKASGITSDVQQYYSHIWNHMKDKILKMNLSVAFPESIVACPILLMNGRVQIKILSKALTYNISENDWRLILNKLFPLIIPCENDGEYTLFHNDFRVFLMGIINGYHERYEEIAFSLAKYVLENDEGILTYISGIPLLQCANKNELIPEYFTPKFVINALAEGISKQRLADYVHLSYKAACITRNMKGYVNTYLSTKTLCQHIKYYDYYNREYLLKDFPEIASFDISEIRTLPITYDNLLEYEKVLDLCKKLSKSNLTNHYSRSLALYNKWFSELSPYSFTSICENKLNETENWHLRTDEVGIFLQHWGEALAELNFCLPSVDTPNSELQYYALTTFGETYFETCIKQGKIDSAIVAIKNHYISKSCFAEKIEDILYNGFANEVQLYLKNIFDITKDQSTKFLSLAALATCEDNISFDTAVLESSTTIKHIYDESSLIIILKSFLLGYNERTLDDIVICGHVNKFYSEIEENEVTQSQIANLSKFACLLGKYYWNSSSIDHSNFFRFIKWFLTSKMPRRMDYSRARKFLLFLLLKSHVCKSLAKNEEFINYLRTYLFHDGSLGMHYKTYILDYFQQYDRLDIIAEYIFALYGENCTQANLIENKKEMHDVFCRYGKLVKPEMMQQFSSHIKWDVVGYIEHKETAMEGLSKCFKYISTNDPSLWQDLGKQLYYQSKIAEISGNEYACDIRNNIMKAAVNSGIDDFWKLHFWNDEFRIDPNLIHQALFEYIQIAESVKDLEAIWLLNCGIHSWYMQNERVEVKSVFDACLKKAHEFKSNFREIVLTLTPQWMVIIDYESDKTDYLIEENDYNKRRYDDIKGIKTEYESVEIEELLKYLPTIPVMNYAKERYSYILDRLNSNEELSIDKAKLILKSVCSYLKNREWSFEQFDRIITTLLAVLDEDAFWFFAHTIENVLFDFDYQTSTHNMQLLLILYLNLSNKSDNIKFLFEQELITQEMWINGNNHIPIDYKITPCAKQFSAPKTLVEMIFYILTEQISTQVARKMETAIFSIYVLGKRFNCIMDTIASEWANFSNIQKDYLLIIISRWIYDGINLGKLYDLLILEYNECNFLSRKYYLHSILLSINTAKIDKKTISYNAEVPKYVHLNLESKNDLRLYKTFLSLTEKDNFRSNTFDAISAIRKHISQFHTTEVYSNDQYAKFGDLSIPTFDPDVNKILYCEEKHGRWDNIPLLSKKSMLLPLEDPFILTEMPQIIYDENWFPNVTISSLNTQPTQEFCETQFSIMARQNIPKDEMMLAACIWYPWGYDDGSIFFETSKICSAINLNCDKQINWCIGNFGLLTKEGNIYEADNPLTNQDGINLFNQIGGNIIICFGNSQIVPSSAWRNLLKCAPSSISPYIWVDENENEVLRFERIASPIREGFREKYFRQPVLFRWICNSSWLQKKMEKLKMRFYYVHHLEKMI